MTRYMRSAKGKFQPERVKLLRLGFLWTIVSALAAKQTRRRTMNEFLHRRKRIAFALLAAVLFGLSTPLAKAVSPRVEPVLLAGLLYLGSGIGLGTYFLYQATEERHRAKQPSQKTMPRGSQGQSSPAVGLVRCCSCGV